MIDVTVKVPEDRIAEFYALVGSWLSGEPASGEEDDGEAVPSDWANTDDDLRLAAIVWTKFSPRARALFSLLMERPGTKISGEEIARALNIPHGKYGVAGVLAWPGRRCLAVGRTLPWKYEDGPVGGSASYWVDPEIADLFGRVDSGSGLKG